MRNSIVLMALLALGVGAAHAADHQVRVGADGSNRIVPENTDVAVGDTVTFVNDGSEHNVASVAGSAFAFRCAVDCAAGGGPSATAWTSTITIPAQAAHRSVRYYCERHGLGMSATLTVTNPVQLQSFAID